MANAGSSEGYGDSLTKFTQFLRGGGYIEGQNLAIEPRWANNRYDRLPALAAELVQRRCAVIVASTTPSVRAAKAATTTIPVVFGMAGDPVKLGFVGSLSRPEGNITGVTLLVMNWSKRLEVLREAVPSASVIDSSSIQTIRIPRPTSQRPRQRRIHFDENCSSLMSAPTPTLSPPLRRCCKGEPTRSSWLPIHSSTVGAIGLSRFQHVMQFRRSTHGVNSRRWAVY